MVTSCLVILPGAAAAHDEGDVSTINETGSVQMEQPLDGSGLIIFDPFPYQPYIPIIYASLLSLQVRQPSTSPFMYVLVQSSIYASLSDEIARYADDVERTGLGVGIWTIGSSADPEDIKLILTNGYSIGLVGCLMVGDISPAWYHINTVWVDGDADVEDFPCDLFYMDMDGNWGDADNDGMFDSHTDGGGDMESEIWVGRLKTDQMQGDAVQMLEDYFDKNHAYRTGALTFPLKALTYVDDDWAPGTDVSNAVSSVFGDNTLVNAKATTAKADYLDELTESYSMVHVMCHGNPGGQHFKVPSGGGSTWEPNADILGDDDIAPIDDNVLFYNLFVCSSARFTSDDYLAGWYVQSGDTLVAVGSTKTGSMINDAAFYTGLDIQCVGDSFNDWFDATLQKYSDSVPWTMGMTIIGDPTIMMAGPHQVNIETTGLPGGILEDAVKITSGGVVTYADLVDGKWSGMCAHGTVVEVQPLFMYPWFSTNDQHVFTVVEPFTAQIDYVKQHQVHIEAHGLPTSNEEASVRYTSMGTSMVSSIWDGNDFLGFCDDGTEVSVDEIVVVEPDEERYITGSTTSWTLSDSIDEDVFYTHQYRVLVDVQTVGIHPLDSGNYVECKYRALQWMEHENLYDSNDLEVWANAGSTLFIDQGSSMHIPYVRWATPSDENIIVNGPISEVRYYFEQYWMRIESNGLDVVDYQGYVHFFKFDTSSGGHFWDDDQWADWCDVGSVLAWSVTVAGPPCVRYHTPPPFMMLVDEPEELSLEYHTEYQITLAAEGLPDGQSTDVKVGVADPLGTDIANYIVTLSSTNSFSWTGWVHIWTDMTATSLVTLSPNEKYLLVCWTIADTTWAPPTIYAMGPCYTYTAHYMGIKKDMPKDAAGLTESVKVNLQVSLTSAIDPLDLVTLVDELPNEFSFVVGSAKDNGAAISPTLTNVMVSPYHQRLTFKLGPGDHDIWFEVRVNRAYASDRTVTNTASATFDLKELDPMTLGVEDKLVIHPYVGPTFSVVKTGPDVVKWHTNVSWEMTFIVKNNYNYVMKGATVKDCFGPEIKYLANSVRANLVTKPIFTITGYQTKQVGMSWGLGDVQAGEAFMLQVTIHTTEKGIMGGQGFTMLNQNPLDFGASLKFTNCNNNLVTLTALPLWVKAVI